MLAAIVLLIVAMILMLCSANDHFFFIGREWARVGGTETKIEYDSTYVTMHPIIVYLAFWHH